MTGIPLSWWLHLVLFEQDPSVEKNYNLLLNQLSAWTLQEEAVSWEVWWPPLLPKVIKSSVSSRWSNRQKRHSFGQNESFLTMDLPYRLYSTRLGLSDLGLIKFRYRFPVHLMILKCSTKPVLTRSWVFPREDFGDPPPPLQNPTKRPCAQTQTTGVVHKG